MLFTVHVGESKELLEQEGVFEDPLDGFDEVRFQRGGMLPAGVLGIQERLESRVSLGCRIHMEHWVSDKSQLLPSQGYFARFQSVYPETFCKEEQIYWACRIRFTPSRI